MPAFSAYTYRKKETIVFYAKADYREIVVRSYAIENAKSAQTNWSVKKMADKHRH